MTTKDHERMLAGALRLSISAFGFVEESLLWFVRTNPGVAHCLGIGTRTDQHRVLVSGTAGISFSGINTILKPEIKEAIYPTVVVPFHFLHENRSFFEWAIESVDAVAHVAEEITVEIRDFAVPFFEKYSDLAALKSSLESPNPMDWFCHTPEQRIVTLAAIEAVEGDTDKAIRILDEALAERMGAPPKKRSLIELIRGRLLLRV